MTPRPLFSALGFTIAIFSMSAIGQVNYGNAPSPGTKPAAPEAATATAPQKTAATTTAPAPEMTAAATTEPANKKHAGKMHAHSAQPHDADQRLNRSRPPVAMSGTGDPAYRAALKQCIAGPETQRDSCLDDAHRQTSSRSRSPRKTRGSAPSRADAARRRQRLGRMGRGAHHRTWRRRGDLFLPTACLRIAAPPPPGTSREAPPGAALPGDAIRHPLPEALVQSVPQEPLPPLDRSDAALREALVALAGPVSARDLFHPDEIARRVVVTVDNLPRRKLPAQLLPVKPVAGSLVTSPDNGGLAVAAANDARYAAYAAMMTAVDTKKLVAAYVRFYPLFQEEYRALGYPYGAFNDRVIEAIDDLLAAPEIGGPVGLVQPKVVYEFADPGLESLSAGQKLMVRIGPRNERAAKAGFATFGTMTTAAR